MLLATAAAEATPLPECPVGGETLGLVFEGEVWPPTLIDNLSDQLIVEAERLALIACDGRSDAQPPTIQVQLALGSEGLGVTLLAKPNGVERRLDRQLSAPSAQGAESSAELAMVIGELAREILRAPAPPPPLAAPPVEVEPPPSPELPRWALGVRGVAEVAKASPFFGLDLQVRYRTHAELELTLNAAFRQSASAESALGSVQAQLWGAGPGLAYRLLGDHHHSLAAAGGLRIAGLRLSGTPQLGAIGEVVWDWAAAAQLGLELAYAPTTPLRLVIGLGASYGLRGVTAKAGDEEPLSSRGWGLYLSVGGEGWL